MSDWLTLFELLRDGRGHSRELDVAIEIAALLRRHAQVRASQRFGYVVIRYGPDEANSTGTRTASRFTADVRDALKLLEDTGYWWLISKGATRPDEPLFGVVLFKPNEAPCEVAAAEHDDLARAICMAACAGFLARDLVHDRSEAPDAQG